MLERRGDMERDQRDEHVRRADVDPLQHGVDLPVVDAERGNLDEAEVLHAELAEVGGREAGDRYRHYADVQERMARSRGYPFLGGHRFGERRWSVREASAEPREDEHSEREADRLVEVDPDGALRRAARHLLEVPAEADLEQDPGGEKPMERDGGARVALFHRSLGWCCWLGECRGGCGARSVRSLAP